MEVRRTRSVGAQVCTSHTGADGQVYKGRPELCAVIFISEKRTKSKIPDPVNIS
jgi:hypothetical protein